MTLNNNKVQRESTYNKYRRQNKELKMLLSIETKNFVLDAKDYQERIKYIHRCITQYRVNKLGIISPSIIIELGLLRKRNRCANCDKEMDVPDYNIQLCKACRMVELDKYAKEKLICRHKR